VELRAEPESGYEFVRWSGDLQGERDNPFTITMDKAMTIEAVFREKSNTPIWVWAMVGAGVAAGAGALTYLNKKRRAKARAS